MTEETVKKNQTATRTLWMYLLALLPVASLVLAQPAAGGPNFAIEYGENEALCKVYTASLNKQKQPMFRTGGLSRNKDGEDPAIERPQCLRKIYWHKESEWSLMAATDAFEWSRNVNPVRFLGDPADWRDTPEQYAAAWKSYSETRWYRNPNPACVYRVDVDNDGELDTLYQEPPYRTYSVLNVDLTAQGGGAPLGRDFPSPIDGAKTEAIAAHPPLIQYGYFRPRRSWERPLLGQKESPLAMAEEAGLRANYSVLRFDGRTYFDVWWEEHPSFGDDFGTAAGRLRVYTVIGNEQREICSLRYVGEFAYNKTWQHR